MVLINHFSNKSCHAVRKGYNYHSNESIVVEFNPYNEKVVNK